MCRMWEDLDSSGQATPQAQPERLAELTGLRAELERVSALRRTSKSEYIAGRHAVLVTPSVRSPRDNGFYEDLSTAAPQSGSAVTSSLDSEDEQGAGRRAAAPE